jgi:DNA repair protein RecO (recombination protein O)
MWRARLDEHLGHYTVEGLRLRTGALLSASHAVYGITHLAALTRLLPERDPHPAIYGALEVMLDALHDVRVAAPLIVRFELQLLAELGFGLALDQCAATGIGDDLVYVSPKSGRAVSREAGEPWRDKLLRLPAFLAGDQAEPSAVDLSDGFAMTAFFLSRHVLEPRGLTLSDAREPFIATVLRTWPAAQMVG